MNVQFKIDEKAPSYEVYDPAGMVKVASKGGNADGDSHFEMTGPGWRLFYTISRKYELPDATWRVLLHASVYPFSREEAHSLIESHLRTLHGKIWVEKGVDSSKLHYLFV